MSSNWKASAQQKKQESIGTICRLKKIFSNHASDKGLMFKAYKEFKNK
jgi:hypothetical protein